METALRCITWTAVKYWFKMILDIGDFFPPTIHRELFYTLGAWPGLRQSQLPETRLKPLSGLFHRPTIAKGRSAMKNCGKRRWRPLATISRAAPWVLLPKILFFPCSSKSVDPPQAFVPLLQKDKGFRGLCVIKNLIATVYQHWEGSVDTSPSKLNPNRVRWFILVCVLSAGDFILVLEYIFLSE